MASCCQPGGYDKVFNPRFARHTAARYRRRGLDRTARRMADWLVEQGIDGASVLEIGGGVGAIQLDLLARGAERTTNLELSNSYESDAARLNAEHGLADRVDRRIGDIAADGSVAEPADIVVLHRVVCCYPDVDRLLGSAADHARRAIVFSHPPRNATSRAVSGLVNATQRLIRSDYRSFVHSPQRMIDLLGDRGFTAEHVHRGPIWEIIAATRTRSEPESPTR